MVRVPISSGVVVDPRGVYRRSLPRNLTLEFLGTGISDGFLRPADGIEFYAVSNGLDRGGYVWRENMYRVGGGGLYKYGADGSVGRLGDIPGVDPVVFDHSFDRLAICADDKLYYCDGESVTQVVDADLGAVKDFVFIDGYFLTTDGEFLITTELNDPLSVNPIKYGSSERDPDDIIALRRINGEVYAFNRNTIEVFSNVGGSGFPFARVPNAFVSRGPVSREALTVVDNTAFFVGSARNEPLGFWMATASGSAPFADSDITEILSGYSQEDIAAISLESRLFNNRFLIYAHLKDRTLVYDATYSRMTGAPAWHMLTSGTGELGAYGARHFTHFNGKTYCGDPRVFRIGFLSNDTREHYGEPTTWRFDTPVVYSGDRYLYPSSVELIASSYVADRGATPRVYMQYSRDGTTFSRPKFIETGKRGDRARRLLWRNPGKQGPSVVFRFGGDSSAAISFAALEVNVN